MALPAGYNGSLPDSVLFIDGGIMSNFPINNVCHKPYRMPTSPTFGAKIRTDRVQPAIITKPSQLLGAVFDAARHTLDFGFISRNQDHKHLVAMIDTGDDNWLNFSMEDGDKIDPFSRDATAAAEFLRTFNWPTYKTIRKGIADAFLASYNSNGATAVVSGNGRRIETLPAPYPCVSRSVADFTLPDEDDHDLVIHHQPLTTE